MYSGFLLQVLADCRGDLHPNPQFDAINVISLAIEEDTRPGIEVYVLMRGNGDEFCRCCIFLFISPDFSLY